VESSAWTSSRLIFLQEIELIGGLYLTWSDPRLIIADPPADADAAIHLDSGWRQRLWLPDLWVENLRDFVVLRSMSDQVALDVFANKTLKLWQS